MNLLPLAVLPIFLGAALTVVPLAAPPAQAGLSPLPHLQASPSATSVWWVGASSADSSALPNTGVRATIQVISFQTSNVLNFWVSDALSNNMWGQVGYVINGGSAPWAFWQVWNLNTNQVVGTGSTAISTGYHTFSMYLQGGTTWAFAVDGSAIGSYNMGASSSSTTYPVYALSEEQASAVFSFPSVTFSSAMQVLRSGTWGSVNTAVSYGTAWGVQGQVQNPALNPDEIVVGGSTATISARTLLWPAGSTTSGTSTTTSYSSPPSTTTATSTVTATATSTATLLTTTTLTTTQTTTSPTTTTATVTSTSTSTVTATGTTTQTSTSTRATTSTVTTTQSSTTTATATVTTTSTQTLQSTTTTTLTTTQTASYPTTTTATVTTASTTALPVTTTTTETITTTDTANYTTTVTGTIASASTTVTVTSVETSASTLTTTTTQFDTTPVTSTVTETEPTTVTVAVTTTVAHTTQGGKLGQSSPSNLPASYTTCPYPGGASLASCTSSSGVASATPSVDGGSLLAVSVVVIAAIVLGMRWYIHS